MNRNQQIIHQHENIQYISYVNPSPTMISPIQPNYIQPNTQYFQVVQPMIIPITPQYMSSINNSPSINKHPHPPPHQQQIITPTPLQPQPSNQALIHKKPYKSPIPPQVNKVDFRPWSPEEDQHIMNMVNTHGPRFDVIANSLHDRSPLETSNRFYDLQRNVFPIPSIQSKQAGYYEDADQCGNDEYSNFLFKHVPCNTTNSDFSNASNFQFLNSEENEYESDMCTLNFAPPGIENNQMNIC